MVCRLLCAHLASSRGQGCGGGWECGEYWKMTGAPLKPATGGGHQCTSPLSARSPQPLPHHRLLLPIPLGSQCSGRGEQRRGCALPSAPTPEMPRPPTATSPSCTEDSGGHQGLLVCLVLSCVCVRSPSAFSVSFVSSLLSFSPAPAPTPEFSTGERVTPPSLPPGSPTHSCFLLFYVRVCIIYFFLPPLFCPPSLPLLPCNWRMCNEFANSWTVRLLCSPVFLLCLPSSSSLPTLSFLQCFLRAVSTIWKLERN